MADDAHDEAVLPLVLGNTDPPTLRVVCKLLGCSRSIAALVHSTCAGRVDLRV
jgi:hypothetical protein